MFLLDRLKEGLMQTVVRYAPVAMAEPENYEARANLQWAASWAINGFTGALQNVAWTCHPIEHELSAIYDITHGLGLAIITPKWMKYILDEKTVSRFYDYGVHVFGIDGTQAPMDVAKQAIAATERFFYETLGLASTLSAIGIDDQHFALMAKRACGGDVLPGFRPLRQADIEEILRLSL